MERAPAATTEALAREIGARLEGPDRPVRGLARADAPEPEHLVVAPDDATVRAVLARPEARELAGLLVREGLEIAEPHPPLLRHRDPRLALARLSAALDPTPAPAAGVDPHAVVDPDADLAEDVTVGPGAVVEAGATLGRGCRIGSGAFVGRGCTVGRDAVLGPRVVLLPGVRLGARVRVHAGAVLGSDGFGYAAGPDGPEKIHHLGGVEIGDDVEIGANTCVDRGTLGDTVVGPGTKIDNLCQVAHNVTLGRACLVAGCTGIGGSSVLEDGVIVGGGAAFSDHVTVGRGAQIAGRAGVTKDVPAGERWGGYPARPVRAWARERYLLGKLEAVWAYVRARTG